MDINQRKEQFSRAYVQVIASVAGYALYQPGVDDDSIDCGIAARGGEGTIRSPRVELQLKCTAGDIIGEDLIAFPLGIKNYNDLRIENVLVPRILVVVMVPTNIDHWLEHSEDALCLKCCGYWTSLKGMPATENVTSVTVSLPRSNQFTVAALRQIIERLGRGEAL